MSLDPAVQALVDGGQLVLLDLIRFDLPGATRGYHRGGRQFTWNGLTYKPNRWLDAGGTSSALGVAVTSRTIKFSNIPTSDPNDAIAKLELFDYINAPVIVSTLAGNPQTDQVAGILTSTIYEINDVTYDEGAVSDLGERSLTVSIELQPPGRSARGSTLIKVSPAEQKFDNDLTDTSLDEVATNATIQEEWGQRSG